MEVKQISSKDTYAIRQQILFPEVGDHQFNGDDADQTIHLGAFRDKKLVSVASFYFNSHPDLDYSNQFQIQGMATLPEYQGQGLSRELLKVGFPLIKRNFADVVWCFARTSAVGFYEKTGFEKLGCPFNVDEIGEHQLMFHLF